MPLSDQQISVRLDRAIKGRPVEKGVTLDSLNTRRMDDGFSLAREGDGWVLKFSFADVAALTEKDDAIDRYAKKRAYSDKGKPLPNDFVMKACSLLPGKKRPAITMTMHFASDFELMKYDIRRTAFINTAKYARETMADEVPRQQLADWHEFTAGISRRRKGQMQESLTRGFNRHAVGANYKYEDSCTAAHGCPDMIMELTVLASRVAADYMRKNNLPAFYRIAGDPEPIVSDSPGATGAMKDWIENVMDDIIASVDVTHLLSVDVTTPIRRYDNLMMQRILTAHLDGKKSPYSEAELDSLKKTCRWARRNPRSISTDFNDLVRNPDAPAHHPSAVPESNGREKDDLYRLCDREKLGRPRFVSGRIRLLGHDFYLEGAELPGRHGKRGLRAMASSDNADDAGNGAAAGILQKLDVLAPA